VTVAITICSWIAISNHCSIPVSFAQEKIAQSECPFHTQAPKPAKQDDSTDQPCCKILRALVPSPAKSWTRSDSDFRDVDLSFEAFVFLADAHQPAPLLLDTGPPEARTFAELILQRSILAHAPPSLG